ncbi:MAG: M56 family metallopeptidase [Planctomycetota bacterium]|nr:M56 family metallopeptidase [Planctomycetota bacterium]
MIALESAASQALQFALERSVAFTIVFLVLASAWWILKNRLSSHVGSVWFLLPMVVLVVPVERWVPNPWNASNPIERATLSFLPDQGERTFIDPTTAGFLDLRSPNIAASTPETATPGSPTAVSAPTPWATLLLGTWILCMLTYLIRLALGQGRMQSLLRSAQVLSADSMPVNLNRVLRSAGISRTVLFLESPEFDSPVLWNGRIPAELAGSKNPAAIILPEGLNRRLSREELRWVLLHELAHLARGDHRTELLQRILGAAFLFHPLVWMANRLSRSYREMACDDAALARCSETDRKRCARALFEVVAHAAALSGTSARPAHRTTHAMSSLFHSKKLTRRRIMRLTEIDRPLARGLRLSALFPVLLVSSMALAAAHFPAVLQEEEITEEVVVEEFEHDSSPAQYEAKTRAAARNATDWLLKNQNKAGGWSYTKPKPAEVKEWGAGYKDPAISGPDLQFFQPYHNDVALTALALQSLVQRANKEGSTPEINGAIDRAIAYLLSKHDAESGMFGTDEFTVMVAQSLAIEALSLAAKDRMTPEVLATLKSGVKLLEKARNPYMAWRYDRVPVGDNDSRITGYVMLALVRAFEAGAHADPETMASGMNYLNQVEDAKTGRTHYMHDQVYAFRLQSHKNSHPAERAEAPTAMHLRLRNEPGFETIPRGAMDQSIDLLVSKAPIWDLAKGAVDYTYWWHGTEALAGCEAATDRWPIWRDSLRAVLIELQISEGELAGTWPTLDAWSTQGYEVYTTATCALALYASLGE